MQIQSWQQYSEEHSSKKIFLLKFSFSPITNLTFRSNLPQSIREVEMQRQTAEQELKKMRRLNENFSRQITFQKRTLAKQQQRIEILTKEQKILSQKLAEEKKKKNLISNDNILSITIGGTNKP